MPVIPFLHTKALDFEVIQLEIEKYLDQVDGVIMQGGADIDPGLYLDDQQPQITDTNIQDWIDFYLVQTAFHKNIPVLGVCRGLQMINVAFGGTLIAHLSDRVVAHSRFLDDGKKDYNFGSNLDSVDFGKIHSVELSLDGFLYNLLEINQIPVNSVHHQGIDRLGQGLSIEAIAPDGLIEAISVKDKKILGLQWHPELDLEDEYQKKIVLNWLDSTLLY